MTPIMVYSIVTIVLNLILLTVALIKNEPGRLLIAIVSLVLSTTGLALQFK